MNLPGYTFETSNTFLEFEFESLGPKGKIRAGSDSVVA